MPAPPNRHKDHRQHDSLYGHILNLNGADRMRSVSIQVVDVHLPLQMVGQPCGSHPLYQLESNLPNSQNHLKRNAIDRIPRDNAAVA